MGDGIKFMSSLNFSDTFGFGQKEDPKAIVKITGNRKCSYKSPYPSIIWVTIILNITVNLSLRGHYAPECQIAKGKQIVALSRALRQFIEQENEKDATVILLMLLGMGVKLKAVR